MKSIFIAVLFKMIIVIHIVQLHICTSVTFVLQQDDTNEVWRFENIEHKECY